MRKGWLFIAISLAVLGCATAPKREPDSFRSVYDREEILAAMKKRHSYTSRGSIWKDFNLYSDIKARRVGDIVTIIVREYASSKDSGTTESDKKASFSTVLKSLMGLKDEVSSIMGMKDPTNFLDVSASGKFKGSGKIEQTSSLQTRITAMVVDVLPNGNLVIEGKRTIYVNGEKKIIAVRGIVRPEDIKPDNTVPSEALADAEIIYQGKGIVSQSHSPGLFTKLLLWLWPLL